MRLSVLLFCVLGLAACVLLVRETSLRPCPGRSVADFGPRTDAAGPTNAAVFEISRANIAVDQDMIPQTRASCWQKQLFEIAAEPEWLQSQEELEELAGTVPDNQIRDVLNQLATQASDATMIFGKALVHRWATNSLADAVQWAEQLPDTSFAHAAFAEIVIPWADSDLSGAVEWVQQLPAGGNRVAAELSLASEAATRKEGVTAITLIAGLPSSSERDELLNYSACQWATVDQERAVSWIGEVQDPVLREQMLVTVADGLGVQNPTEAASFALSVLPSGPALNHAMIDIIRFMAVSAPDQAAAWVEQLPGGNLRGLMLENLIDVWDRDSTAVSERTGAF